MSIDFEKDYIPLKDAAIEMGVAKSTLYQYCKMDLLDGAHLLRGTKWMIAKKTIDLWKNGKINIKGAFRKGD
jgi:hypothetical protein